MSAFIEKVSAAVTKARRVNGPKKEKMQDDSSQPDTPIFKALKMTLLSKVTAKNLENFDMNMSPKDLRAFFLAVGPSVVSALLVDLDMIKKNQQVSFARRLTQATKK